MKIWNKHLSAKFRSFAFAVGLATGAIAPYPLFASADGECHFHGNKPAAEATVLTCAEMHKLRLIKKGTIAPSWAAIKHDSIQQVDVKGGKKKEWKLVFKDAAAKDKAKAIFYMFFSISGNFLASNFTGN